MTLLSFNSKVPELIANQNPLSDLVNFDSTSSSNVISPTILTCPSLRGL